MTLLPDVSVWIEFLRRRDPYFGLVSDRIDNVAAFEPIFGELLQGARNNRDRQFIVELWNTYETFIETTELFGGQKYL